MNVSNSQINAMEIIQLFVPVVTFVMGYFLTNVGYKRDKKLSIIREKFEKLYHPFYVMINKLGSETDEGFAFSIEDSSALKQFFDHFSMNMYLASPEGQKLFWEARNLFMRCIAKGDEISKEQEYQFDKSMSVLFGHLLQEYVKSANILGYELGGAEAHTNTAEVK